MTRRAELVQNLQVSLWEYNRRGVVKRALKGTKGRKRDFTISMGGILQMQDKFTEDLKQLFYQVMLGNEQRRARLEDMKKEDLKNVRAS